MSRGGYRPGAGRKKGSKNKSTDKKTGLPSDIVKEAKKVKLSPLDYMLKVINDETADPDRKDKLAIAAAQYVHPRPGTGPGKKQERQERANKAGSGKFAPSAPPLLKAVK